MNNINKFKEAIIQAKKIIIIPHVNPDGDTISSTLALAMLIEKYFNKNVQPVIIGKLPEVYRFLPSLDKLININELNKREKYDLAIAVDIASKDRLNEASSFFDNAKISVNIDHHKTNNGYGTINFVDPKACSAGQVVFDIAEKLELEISEEVAICLFTSILTDTGGFKYENTSVRTLETAAKLVALKANPCEISRACYESKPQGMVMLQAFAIDKSTFLENGQIAYSIITRKDMKKFNAADDYTDGISEALRQIKTVEVSMVLKETDNGQTKVSLRSKNIDVSKIASNFNGGGHQFAAGCTVKKPISIALNKLLEYIKKEIK